MQTPDSSFHKPAVGKLLENPALMALENQLDRSCIKQLIHSAFLSSHDENEIIEIIQKKAQHLLSPNLRKVINATGILLHTNLGRAPLGHKVGQALAKACIGYSNLEFDLEGKGRGGRQSHVKKLLCQLTGAEDALVVNNNAAALVLILRSMALGKEVIVSRGELVEIGGSFRIPDILETSGAKLVEVGTTNITSAQDYEKKINPETGMLFKAHQSNYKIVGHTEAPSLEELAELAEKHNLPFVYDQGSGMLIEPPELTLTGEDKITPKIALHRGVDILTMSGDKLLGGPQAGIILGKKKYLDKLSKDPLMRAVRPSKLILVALEECLLSYLSLSTLKSQNPLYQMLDTPLEVLLKRHEVFHQLLLERNIQSQVVPHKGQVGGGTLPGVELPGYALELASSQKSWPQKVHTLLLQANVPILTVLKEGKILIDLRATDKSDQLQIYDSLKEIYSQGPRLATQ